MKKLLLSSFVLMGLTVCGFAQYTPVNFLQKPADPEDFSESVTIYGAPGNRTTVVPGYGKCTQTMDTLTIEVPWNLGFEHIWNNPINYIASGTIPYGQSSVTVTVFGNRAENETGRSAWDGWYLDNNGTHINESIRKIAWVVYDLRVQGGG